MSATRLDRVFHERGRLAICSALVTQATGMSFTRLQEVCGLTDGNLNRHLHALAEEQIVESERRTGNGRPQTMVRITEAGRARFVEYIDALEAIVREVQRAAKRTPSPARAVPSAGTSQ
ncbi:MAG: transcriptional regulator [Vulcanimicrobiaceae bacterium]